MTLIRQGTIAHLAIKVPRGPVEKGKGLANGTINRSVSALRRMFSLAKKDGKLRDVPYFPLVKEARPRQGFFERSQFDSLYVALPNYVRVPLALGYFAGMRLSEVLNLKWGQVDFLAGTINLLAGETKNDEARTVPVVPQLRAILEAQHANRQPSCDYVCFRLDRAGHAAKIGGFRKAWYSACVKLGLGKMAPAVSSETGEPIMAPPRGPRSKPKPKMIYQGMIFHDLRRSAVRNLVRAGVPESIAMKVSGHKTRSVFERYNIVSQGDILEAGRKLAILTDPRVGDNSGTITPLSASESYIPN